MKFHELQATRQKAGKRAGRGISAGRGKTAGRGTKGQNARTGGGTRPGFEGGQNPLVKRLPKLPGFRSIRPKAENVYTGQLDNIKGVVDNFSLFNAGIVSNPYTQVKLVVKGEVKKKTTVKLQAASEGAIEKVQKAGGSFTKVEQVKRQTKEKTAKR